MLEAENDSLSVAIIWIASKFRMDLRWTDENSDQGAKY
jgi:hypothetical protein